MVRGCRATRTPDAGIEEMLQENGTALAGDAGAGLSGDQPPLGVAHGLGARKRLAPPPLRGPPLSFLERPPAARYRAGLRGLLGAGRQGAAQRPARPDVAWLAGTCGGPGLGRSCWAGGCLEFTTLKLV